MKLEDATRFTAGCFRGEPASCSCACPFHMDIRAFLEKGANGRWAQAYKTFRNATVFPLIVSVLCDRPCRERCQRTLVGDEPLALGELEAAAIRYAKSRKPESYVIPPKKGRIAVIGAGLAGLSCALNLAQKKFSVTLFEKGTAWGGALRDHPRFAEFDADIALQFSAVKPEFRYGTEVKSLAELDDFDAVYIATGKGGDAFGLRESWDPELFTTSAPKAFLGGELCDVTLMEAIAHGVEASKIIEIFLQTGKASRPYGSHDKVHCGRSLDHTGAPSSPIVTPAGPDGYTEEEAKAEAGRCLQCDCDRCMTRCEMLARFRKDPHKIAVEVFNDMGTNPPFSVRTITREVYSCNICGYCQSVCPEQVNIGHLLQFSRTARMNANSYPAALHDFWIREMDFASSEGAFASAPRGKKTCTYAFYPGCQLGAANPEHVLRSFAFLEEKYDGGVMLGCCGAPAYWAGDEKRLRANLTGTREAWAALGNPTLVFACATCEHLFRLFLPDIPGVSLYQLLAEAADVRPSSSLSVAAVFDPCAARDDSRMQAGVRTLAGKAGVALEELKEPNRCCGYGGHMRIANPDLYEEIAGHRATASDKPYIVYCANCREVFASRGKECAHILDTVFGLTPGPVPTLAQKRENSLNVKKALMQRLQGGGFEPRRDEWDRLQLTIPDEVQKRMERKLISAADLKEAIWFAEASGDTCNKFYDETDGMCICSMTKAVVTYWVQYRKTGPDAYEIAGAYYHRMRFSREE